MKKNGYTIKSINQHRMDMVIDWAATEGWNPGLHDAEAFYDTDPEGFFLGKLDGEPIGCISAVKYNKHFGFIGLYIVRPEFRGKGFGIKLWDAALQYLGARNIGLDGVVDQQEKYKKSGFRLAYRNIRYEGSDIAAHDVSSKNIVTLDQVRFPALQAYDKSIFLASRPQFVKAWINQEGATALGRVDDDGHLCGYGVIRPCRVGYKIGPLFAERESHAEELLQALVGHAGNGPVYIDVPEANQAAVGLVERFGMKPVFETARMYSQEALRQPLGHIFGVSSLELG